MSAANRPGGISIRPESDADFGAIRALLESAFPGPAEAALVERLRADRDLLLAYVATDAAGAIAGYAAYPRLTVNDNLAAAGLAPLAVSVACRRRGIGALLVESGIAWLRQNRTPIVFVLGDPAYYRRFGFDAATAAPFTSPFAGPHFMAHRLMADAPSGGRVRYPPAFAQLE